MESGGAGVVRIFIIEIIHAIVVLISAEAAIHEIYLFGAPITIGTSALQENLRKKRRGYPFNRSSTLKICFLAALLRF